MCVFQLAYAAVLSIIYSLVMMLVVVGLIQQAATYGFCSVATIFLVIVVAIFIVAALMHPQEFTCILHGLLYFLSIPAMSMILMIYSLGNLHVVSWGTRETKQPAAPSAKQAPKKNKLQQLLSRLGGDGLDNMWDSLCRCVCCSGSGDTQLYSDVIHRLQRIEEAVIHSPQGKDNGSRHINYDDYLTSFLSSIDSLLILQK